MDAVVFSPWLVLASRCRLMLSVVGVISVWGRVLVLDKPLLLVGFGFFQWVFPLMLTLTFLIGFLGFFFGTTSCKASVRILNFTQGLLNLFLPCFPMARISITYVVFGNSSFIVYMCTFPLRRLSVTIILRNLPWCSSYLLLQDNLYKSTGSLNLLSAGFFQEMSTLMWLFTILMSATLKFLGGPGLSGFMKTNLLGALKELVPYWLTATTLNCCHHNGWTSSWTDKEVVCVKKKNYLIDDAEIHVGNAWRPCWW